MSPLATLPGGAGSARYSTRRLLIGPSHDWEFGPPPGCPSIPRSSLESLPAIAMALLFKTVIEARD